MIDPFGRKITYLRLSVTDRCDLRCVYCMAEDMEFLPKAEVLSLEELERVAVAFMRLGVRKLRLTGGEPLVRRGIMDLIANLGAQVAAGHLDELTLTTNGTQLAAHAAGLAAAGVRRINVSLDSLDPDIFRQVTRIGDLGKVLAGLEAAKAAGLAVKINTVALKGVNGDKIDDLVAWCGEQGFDLTLIETMPLGEIGGDRLDQYVPLNAVRRRLEKRWTLEPITFSSGGPARFVRVAETGRKLGFITPLTEHFCASCNRVRVTCTGTLFPCLGQEDALDLRAPLRAGESDSGLQEAILRGISHKPEGHDFVIDHDHRRPALARYMSTTGG
ncbi:GTP 3',8-cyclase MoaA [Telmatospirillum siberiense]|uniref:GTP 3',8-cyclase n=1 Tax=Telmatospirillum siberiense TaxID=382514 RepID=A0A2N3PPK6_9PROT|nr:GTP 3',8-cyclase MoaA [Telmatospirillum siberiense]PKU22314.1 GTP 3',8-cyclase MoaA [Telmatospirillum siberiense]